MEKSRTARLRRKNVFLAILGTLFISLGTSFFVLPYGLITGGISGISILLASILPAVSMEWWIAMLTWGLFLLGAFTLGRDFALKTLVSTLIYPVGIALFSLLFDTLSSTAFFDLNSGKYEEISILLATLFAGVLIGTGCAITFLGGGSTGGMDVLVFLICKLFPRAKPSQMFFVMDASIISIGLFLTRDIVKSLLGILSAFVCALVIEKIFLGRSRAFIANIISPAYENISNDIIRILERTATILYARGAYLGEEQKMLMVIFRFDEYALLLDIVNSHDSNAFITVYPAHEINGYGWTHSKSRNT